ncbi:MAG TPA: carboxypeptidase-like regulatory domain-containing protein, partial [Candidatus Angelobacter sp.]
EVKLTVKNQAQPFLKVGLPKGATIVSADVAGEKVKPVQGPDGNRVPLLRAGFRPNGPYEVSFVFMDSGAPFAKKGGSELALPSMDVPISLLEWELFLPEQYKVKDFGGDAIAAYLLPAPMVESSDVVATTFSGTNLATFGGVKENESLDRMALFVPGVADDRLGRGQLSGVVVDQTGAVVQGAQVKITLESGGMMTARSDSAGEWLVSGVPSGPLQITVSSQGFKTARLHTQYDSGRPSRYDARLSVGTVSETIEVTAEAPVIETTTSEVRRRRKDHDKERDEKKAEALAQNAASSNVFDLQKRVAGVLPVRIDVPRIGNSYHFARALVLDEETKVTFNYKTDEKRNR